MQMLTKQLIHAFGDDPQNHELSTTTKIGSKVFQAGTSLEDVLSAIGCEISFDFHFWHWFEKHMGCVVVYQKAEYRIVATRSPSHAFSVYKNQSLLSSGFVTPLEGYAYLESHRKTNVVVVEKVMVEKKQIYYHWCTICRYEYSCPIPNPHVYACDSCADERDSEK